jgi:hypothetical protein
MPIYTSGPWRKANAILLTGAARYIAPAVVATVAAVAEYLVGRWYKKWKKGRPNDNN